MHDHLGGYVRDSLLRARHPAGPRAPRRLRGVQQELPGLASVNSEMRALIGPVVLGGAAAAYLGGGKAAGGLGLAAVLGRTRDLVAAHAKTAAVLGVGSTVAAATITTALVRHDARPDPPPPNDRRRPDVITTSRSADLYALTTSPTAGRQGVEGRRRRHRQPDRPPRAVPPRDTSSAPLIATSVDERPRRPPPGHLAAGQRHDGRTTSFSVPTADVGVTVGPSGRSTGTIHRRRWLVTGVPLRQVGLASRISAPASVAPLLHRLHRGQATGLPGRRSAPACPRQSRLVQTQD